MRVLYYDCFSGISGDMNLGAMIDLGVDADYLLEELDKMHLHGYRIEVKKDERKGITGTKVNVILEDHHHDHIHGHVHEHNDGHQHEHIHRHEEDGGSHHHRNLKDIEEIIYNSKLNPRVKELSMKIFEKVAEAEAKVHGKDLYDVHFHEVGAVDSIVDIVGAAICYDYLNVDKVISAPIELGKGFVNCAHGTFPVPAPATMEILKGIPVKKGTIPFEATTPTGAAILATLVSEYKEDLSFNINKIGYGIGFKDEGNIPNVLRVFLGEVQYNQDVYVLECNIDDMNPEVYPYVMDKLMKAGALDVYLTPTIMKKGRPGINLSMLYSIESEEKVKNLVLKETTTLGFRKYRVQRECLNRSIEHIDTPYGEIKVKSAYLNGEKVKCKPEYEDVKSMAEKEGISFNKVYNSVLKELNK
ncbi:nickel pincer cofactor biosynthesis protein LarC [uncultured Clostridium sp.]|uniref:nickel pincer cofactor biosynthesis protein LarC n=1 Tax=uncultured Clostridium sp. TaxID=59620 RepID=UPI0028E1A1DB|nr:nickel pincer cofactor biosynthesis protein LarC [uncultured Clostridium sp.]